MIAEFAALLSPVVRWCPAGICKKELLFADVSERGRRERAGVNGMALSAGCLGPMVTRIFRYVNGDFGVGIRAVAQWKGVKYTGSSFWFLVDPGVKWSV